MKRIAVIGGGPAGLMAAEAARSAGAAVDVFEAKSSAGRKFLIAGKGGLNLTHSEDLPIFIARYGRQQEQIANWLSLFGPEDARAWARELGVETFVGTSGRVFPTDMKAAPLLRAWVHRLRSQGVRFHVRHRCIGFDSNREFYFETPTGKQALRFDAAVFALGGGSWPQLGSDGKWVEWFVARGVSVAPLESSNCGFDVAWSPLFANRYAGRPVKSVTVSRAGQSLQGEFVVTANGIEGSVIYALSADLRRDIARDGGVEIKLDVLPDVALARVRERLALPRKGRTLTEHLRRGLGIEGVKTGLIYEVTEKEDLADPEKLATTIKALSLRLLRPRPLAEAISSAGGVRFSALNGELMVKSIPGIFCAGEMIDWDAPTGGYLLTACLASGRIAGQGAAHWPGP
jgi:uncharacterized flavoprotein (TIGR03862 family)